MAKKTKAETKKVETKAETITEKEKPEKKYLFDFKTFINELRESEEKKEIVEKYERIVLDNNKLEGDFSQQQWYINYVGRFDTELIKYKVPEELSDAFDWNFLFQLIVSSFSSEYSLDYNSDNGTKEIDNRDTLPELYVKVSSDGHVVNQKISELWRFQIERLFEIYCEEQINLEVIRAEGVNEEKGIYKEREERFRLFDELVEENKKENEEVSETDLIRNKDDNDDNYICHYCSLESAYYILRSGRLFASDLSFMNDKEEFDFGIDVLFEALEEIASATHEIDFSDWLKMICKDKRIIKSRFETNSVFITSFSKRIDDLSQWKAYGANGFGVCIVFDSNITIGDPNSKGFTLEKVIYLNKKDKRSKKDWKEELEIIEDYFYDIYCNQKKGKNIGGNIPNSIVNVVDMMSPNIKKRIRFYKNAYFKDEDEIRALSLNENNKYPVEIRVGKECLIPYINLDMNTIDKKTSIKKVIIGPSVRDKDKTKKSIYLYLNNIRKLYFSSGGKEGYDTKGIEVETSSIPYVP